MVDTTTTKQHAKSLPTTELQELVHIERKRIEMHMSDLRALSRKIVMMKHDLGVYEFELQNR